MALNVPVFFKRLGSAIVFVAIMLTGLLWNEWSFLALVCLINFLCLREFFRLMQHIDKESYWPWWLPAKVQAAAFIFVLLVFFEVRGYYHELFDAAKLLAAFAIVFAGVFMLVAILPKQTAWKACMQSFFGLLYISVPMCLLVILHQAHPYVPLFILLLIWTNDTCAYLAGSFIGKTPFSEISPKKTWEGVIGGTILTIGVAMAIGYFYSGSASIFAHISAFAVSAFIVSVAGPAGDLLKSKFKRMANVKDSGNLMPGHGGALDRFDSLIMVTPFIFVYVMYFMR